MDGRQHHRASTTPPSASDEWVSGPTPTYVSATSFTLAGDQTTTFTVGRRLKTTNSGGTVYSTITASAFAAVTTVTVVNDSSSLDAGLSAVSYGLLQAANQSVPWANSAFSLAGEVTPAQITANQNDYNPTGLATANSLRINSDAARNITGLAGGVKGRIIVLHNTGSFGITLKRQDASSSVGNRFAIDADITLAPDQSVWLRYDTTTARWRSGQVADGEFRSMQVFTANGTYTKPTGLKRAFVTVVGAGGGGGGLQQAVTTVAASGAAGGRSMRLIAATAIGATETVTIGAAGTAGVGGAVPTAGGTGGTTSFGALLSATGGAGGGAAPASTASLPGVGGTGSTGDVNIPGAPGEQGHYATVGIRGGAGASTPFGAGGAPGYGSQDGQAASGYGAGGGGASDNNTSARNGGLGAPGLCIVEEFF
jgi:hypothetical protein